jgi:hypothetical protein
MEGTVRLEVLSFDGIPILHGDVKVTYFGDETFRWENGESVLDQVEEILKKREFNCGITLKNNENLSELKIWDISFLFQSEGFLRKDRFVDYLFNEIFVYMLEMIGYQIPIRGPIL